MSDQMLQGLRRRLAQQAGGDVINPDSIVARIRRRNGDLDERIRRNVASAAGGAPPSPHTPHLPDFSTSSTTTTPRQPLPEPAGTPTGSAVPALPGVAGALPPVNRSASVTAVLNGAAGVAGTAAAAATVMRSRPPRRGGVTPISTANNTEESEGGYDGPAPQQAAEAMGSSLSNSTAAAILAGRSSFRKRGSFVGGASAAAAGSVSPAPTSPGVAVAGLAPNATANGSSSALAGSSEPASSPRARILPDTNEGLSAPPTPAGVDPAALMYPGGRGPSPRDHNHHVGSGAQRHALTPPPVLPPQGPAQQLGRAGSAPSSSATPDGESETSETHQRAARQQQPGGGAKTPNVAGLPAPQQQASAYATAQQQLGVPQQQRRPSVGKSGQPSTTSPGSASRAASQQPAQQQQQGQQQQQQQQAAPVLPSGRPVASLLTQVQNGLLSAQQGPAMPRGVGAVSAEKLAEWRRVPLNRSPIAHPYLHEPFLPAPEPHKAGKILLVLDIDETLVHASFAPNKPYHVRLTVEVENDRGHIYVAFRPHLAVFLREVADLFEVAIFTASQACYADQLMNILDPHRRLGSLRLFRDRCTETRGGRVKDLSLLGRPLDRVAIVDNSPIAYAYQRRNAIPILSWFDDPTDTELLKLLPMLRELAKRPNVYEVLDPFNASAL